jgi:hypothetical protein
MTNCVRKFRIRFDLLVDAYCGCTAVSVHPDNDTSVLSTPLILFGVLPVLTAFLGILPILTAVRHISQLLLQQLVHLPCLPPHFLWPAYSPLAFPSVLRIDAMPSHFHIPPEKLLSFKVLPEILTKLKCGLESSEWLSCILVSRSSVGHYELVIQIWHEHPLNNILNNKSFYAPGSICYNCARCMT